MKNYGYYRHFPGKKCDFHLFKDLWTVLFMCISTYHIKEITIQHKNCQKIIDSRNVTYLSYFVLYRSTKPKAGLTLIGLIYFFVRRIWSTLHLYICTVSVRIDNIRTKCICINNKLLFIYSFIWQPQTGISLAYRLCS